MQSISWRMQLTLVIVFSQQTHVLLQSQRHPDVHGDHPQVLHFVAKGLISMQPMLSGNVDGACKHKPGLVCINKLECHADMRVLLYMQVPAGVCSMFQSKQVKVQSDNITHMCATSFFTVLSIIQTSLITC